MPPRSQVRRQGYVIGEHDEPTLLALLNAGTLRLTDTYWHRGMPAPAPLADLLCYSASQTRRAPWSSWLIAFVVACVLVTGLWLRASIAPSHSLEDVNPSLSPNRDEGVMEIRRATPVIRGRLVESAGSSGQEAFFPLHAVLPLAAHSQAAVLALDAVGHPLRLGSGIVVGDGSRFVASLRTVAGASAVQLHFTNGTVQVPTQALVDVASGVVVFTLPQPAFPAAWATEPPSPGSLLAVAGHGLDDSWPSPVARLRESLPGEKRVRYRLDHAYPVSFNGAAILTSSGDLAAVVIDAATGLTLRAADVRVLLQSGIPGSLQALTSLSSAPASADLTVLDTKVRDGQVIVTLINRTSTPLHHAALHLACYDAPPDAAEVAVLEERLRSAAVQASLAPDDASLAARQVLREVTARLESARARLRSALPAAQSRTLRHELLAVDAAFAPGIPQIIACDIDAASNWGASATVLDAGT